jgi:peptidoglycan/xylan/chitin deacetylase (PgdA/CDA1 family)
MYHRLGPGLLADEGDYAVPPALFEAHLQVLARSGRPVLALERLLAADFPEGAVWLTFDDGRESDATEAAPRLLRQGFSAAFFVNPALCGRPGNASFSQLREMVRAGFTVGSHGLDHTLLDGIPEAEARRQIFDSKRLLEDGLGHPVRALSLPGGTGGERARRLADEAGYDLVLGSRPAPVRGAARGRIAPRFAVRLRHSPERFKALLEAGELTWLAHAARFEAAQGVRHLLGEGAYGRLRLLWLGTRAGGGRR